MTRNYLVTGSAGFIGARVVEKLLEGECAVTGIDNLNDAYDVRLKEWRLHRLEEHPAFRFLKQDIRDRDGLRKVFHTEFDAVINLAARAGVRHSVENPWVYYETNVTGTLNLLELCREFNIPKFVLASTSSVYGKGNELPYIEDANTDKPLSPYAASKKAAEALCHAYHYLHGLDVTVPRYFTVYGPAGRPDMSLFRFVKWISEDKLVKIYGDGQQSRDFTYVDDIAEGTIACLKPTGYEIVNLGSDSPTALMENIKLIEKLVNKTARLKFEPRHPADPLATWADINKARRLLDWAPQTDIEDGTVKIVQWYLENRDWARGIPT